MYTCVRDRFFSHVRSSFAMLRVFTKGVVTEITITCTLLSHLQAPSDVTFSGLVLSLRVHLPVGGLCLGVRVGFLALHCTSHCGALLSGCHIAM